MIEREIEDAFCEYCFDIGLQALKLRIDGVNGFPDRTVHTPKGVFYIEFKTPTGRVSKQQIYWLAYLNVLGFKAVVCRSYEESIAALNEFLKDQ
jgi:hypothetical protein